MSLQQAAEMAACEVPLPEQLESVPEKARLVIEDGYGTRFIPVGRMCKEAAEALRQALAQEEKPPVKTYSGGKPNYCTVPEQEPVAWRYKAISKWTHAEHRYLESLGVAEDFDNLEPLYTAPPRHEWGDLTDKEIADARDFVGFSSEIAEEIHYFARHLETKLKEKNT